MRAYQPVNLGREIFEMAVKAKRKKAAKKKATKKKAKRKAAKRR